MIAHLFRFSYIFFEKILETKADIVYNETVYFLK